MPAKPYLRCSRCIFLIQGLVLGRDGWLGNIWNPHALFAWTMDASHDWANGNARRGHGGGYYYNRTIRGKERITVFGISFGGERRTLTLEEDILRYFGMWMDVGWREWSGTYGTCCSFSPASCLLEDCARARDRQHAHGLISNDLFLREKSWE